MWQDLTQPLDEEMPYSTAFDELGTPPTFETIWDIVEDGKNVTYYSLLTHIGTHIDAPIHFIEGGRTIDEFALDRFTGPGAVIDVSQDTPSEITVDDVESEANDIRAGDIVLLYTGWHDKYGTAEYDPHPWLSTALAEWFVDREVGLIGVDTITPDLPGPKRPGGWEEFPVHRILLENEVLIAEHLTNLAPLTGERLEIFAFPIPIRNGDGAQARFVARKA